MSLSLESPGQKQAPCCVHAGKRVPKMVGAKQGAEQRLGFIRSGALLHRQVLSSGTRVRTLWWAAAGRVGKAVRAPMCPRGCRQGVFHFGWNMGVPWPRRAGCESGVGVCSGFTPGISGVGDARRGVWLGADAGFVPARQMVRGAEEKLDVLQQEEQPGRSVREAARMPIMEKPPMFWPACLGPWTRHV